MIPAPRVPNPWRELVLLFLACAFILWLLVFHTGCVAHRGGLIVLGPPSDGGVVHPREPEAVRGLANDGLYKVEWIRGTNTVELWACVKDDREGRQDAILCTDLAGGCSIRQEIIEFGKQRKAREDAAKKDKESHL